MLCTEALSRGPTRGIHRVWTAVLRAPGEMQALAEAGVQTVQTERCGRWRKESKRENRDCPQEKGGGMMKASLILLSQPTSRPGDQGSRLM